MVQLDFKKKILFHPLFYFSAIALKYQSLLKYCFDPDKIALVKKKLENRKQAKESSIN